MSIGTLKLCLALLFLAEVAFGIWTIMASREMASEPNPRPISNQRIVGLLIINLPLILFIVLIAFWGVHHLLVPCLVWFCKVVICKVIPLMAKGYWHLLLK